MTPVRWKYAAVALALTLFGVLMLCRFAKAETRNAIPCRDGTWSKAKHRQGACSYHGGIKR